MVLSLLGLLVATRRDHLQEHWLGPRVQAVVRRPFLLTSSVHFQTRHAERVTFSRPESKAALLLHQRALYLAFGLACSRGTLFCSYPVIHASQRLLLAPKLLVLGVFAQQLSQFEVPSGYPLAHFHSHALDGLRLWALPNYLVL